MQRQEDNLSTILLNRHYKAMPEAKRRHKKNILIKLKFNEIVEPKDVLTNSLNDVKGGNSGFWKDLLDSIAVCSTGCSTGEKTEKKKSVSSDQSQSTVKP